MDWITGVTLAIATLGAVLGIVNTLHQLNRDRVTLRVTPKVMFRLQGQQASGPRLCIEVINLSTFAVTVSMVGFRCKKYDLGLVPPIVFDGGSWPRRLEPRQSVTAFFNDDWRTNKDIPRVRWAVAVTECGVTRYGSMRRLKAKLRKLPSRPGAAKTGTA